MEKKHLLQNNWMILLLATVATALWGSAIPCIKIGYQLFQIADTDLFSKILFAGERFALAGLLVLLVSLVVRRRFPTLKKRTRLGTFLLGLIQTALQYLFFYIALSHISGVKQSILNATGPFFAVLLAHFFCKGEKITLQKSLGCVVGFAGVALVHTGGGLTSGFSITGEGFAILAAFFFSAGSVLNKKLSQKEEAISITGWQLLIGGLILMAVGFVGGGSLNFGSTEAVFLFIYLSLLSSISFCLWSILLRYNPVGKISVYNFLTPVFGVLLSAWWLKESMLNWNCLIALVLVCLGILTVNLSSIQINLKHKKTNVVVASKEKHSSKSK